MFFKIVYKAQFLFVADLFIGETPLIMDVEQRKEGFSIRCLTDMEHTFEMFLYFGLDRGMRMDGIFNFQGSNTLQDREWLCRLEIQAFGSQLNINVLFETI